MRAKWLILAGLVVALGCYAYAEDHLRVARILNPPVESESFFLPDSRLAPMLSMGFRHAWADWTIFTAAVYTSDHREKSDYESGKTLYRILDLAHSLDPERDAGFFFGNYALISNWGLMGVSDANDLLRAYLRDSPRKGDVSRLLVFNHYFYAEDPTTVAKWVKVMASFPDAPQNYFWLADASLRNRESSFGDRARIMCDLCRDSTDKTQKKQICTQCTYLSYAHQLNQVRELYEKEQGKPVQQVSDLAAGGYITEVPADPFGGTWVLNDKGLLDSSVVVDRSRLLQALAKEAEKAK